MAYLAVFSIVVGINLLPAFGPPTWAVLVFTRLHWHLNPIALVVIGAVAASVGRYLLARGTRHFSGRLPKRMTTNVQDARGCSRVTGGGLSLSLPSSWSHRCPPPSCSSPPASSTLTLLSSRRPSSSGGW